MTFEEMLKALEAMENGADYVAAVKAEISKRNNENANLRKRAKQAEETQKKLTETQEKLYDYLGIDPEDAGQDDFDLDKSLEDFKNKQGGKGKTQDSPEFAEMQKKLTQVTRAMDKLTKENGEFKATAEAERNKRVASMTEQAVLKSLTENKALKPSVLTKILTASVKLTDDEKLVFVNDAGEELSVDEGVKAFLATNQEFVVNSQSAGAGSHSSGAGGGAGKFDPVEHAQKLAQERNANQAGVPAGGYNPWGGTSSVAPAQPAPAAGK